VVSLFLISFRKHMMAPCSFLSFSSLDFFLVYHIRYRSHSAPITGLSFGLREQGGQSLVSVGEDRQLVEYDLEESCVEVW